MLEKEGVFFSYTFWVTRHTGDIIMIQKNEKADFA